MWPAFGQSARSSVLPGGLPNQSANRLIRIGKEFSKLPRNPVTFLPFVAACSLHHFNNCTNTPPRVSIRAPQDRVTICAKGSSSIRFALLSTATLPEPPILVVHIPAAIADSIG